MKTHRYLMLLLSIVAILALAGCADSMRREDWAAISTSGATHVYQKMRDHEILNLADIEDLSRHHVDSEIIIRYLRSTSAVYYMNSKQIHRMRKHGVDDEVIDYLLARGREYQNGYTTYYHSSPYYLYGYDPVNDPLYGSFYLDSPVLITHFHHHHHGEFHGEHHEFHGEHHGGGHHHH